MCVCFRESESACGREEDIMCLGESGTKFVCERLNENSGRNDKEREEKVEVDEGKREEKRK